MSLRHALLGLIAELDGASGYDLTKVFEISLGTTWQASHSQLYGELGKLTDGGLIEMSAEGARGRKEYKITEEGREELRHWMTETPPRVPRRDDALLRVFFLDQVEPEAALKYLRRSAETIDGHLDDLAELEKTVPWDEGGGLADNGRLVAEYGKRMLTMRRDWYEWAYEQYQKRAAAGKRKPG